MINNNVALHHRAPALARRAENDQDELRVAEQIEQNEAERPLVRGQENLPRAPGWTNQIRQGLQRGVNAVRPAIRPAIGMGAFVAGTIGGIACVVETIAASRDPYRGPPIDLPMGKIIVSGLLWGIGNFLLDGHRNGESNLKARPLDKVIDEFRAQRASSPSADAPAFNWLQPRLVVNQAGRDVGREVSRFLDRILHAIKYLPGKNANETTESYRQMNEYLDSLERDPALRRQLAESVETLNGACFNRTAQGINAIFWKLRRLQYKTMPFKEFMLNAIADMANTAVELELYNKLKKNLVVETYQAVEGDVLRNLREKFPGLPYQFEDVYQFNTHVELKDEEREKITKEIVKKVIDPKVFAQFLQNCVEANASMEKHCADELKSENVNAPLSNENREKEYAKFAEKNNKEELELDEMKEVDMKLKEERDKKVQEIYAEKIKKFLQSRQDGAGTSQAMEPRAD